MQKGGIFKMLFQNVKTTVDTVYNVLFSCLLGVLVADTWYRMTTQTHKSGSVPCKRERHPHYHMAPAHPLTLNTHQQTSEQFLVNPPFRSNIQPSLWHTPSFLGRTYTVLPSCVFAPGESVHWSGKSPDESPTRQVHGSGRGEHCSAPQVCNKHPYCYKYHLLKHWQY